MAVIPDGYSQVNLRFTGAGVPLGAEMTFGVQNGGFTPAQVALGVSDALSTSNLKAGWAASTTIEQIHVKNGPNDTGPFFDQAVSFVGTLAGDNISPNVALLIKKITLLGGRRGQGRMFQPGLSEGIVDHDGGLNAAFVIAADGRYLAFLNALTAENVPMVVLHNLPFVWVLNENGQPRRQEVAGAIPAPTVVQDLRVDPTAATQRRRLRE
jgi:hypothetical protein